MASVARWRGNLGSHSDSIMTMRRIAVLGVYKRFPKELFRLNKGPQVRLREYKLRWGNSFDILANASGNVGPGALDLKTYAGKGGLVDSDPFAR